MSKRVRLGISGTYSSGKTLTAMAVSHLTGLPRTRARTMREILPEVAPGRTLEECSAAELIQLIVIRHGERLVHESRLGGAWVSDGSSLQEWIYGTVRVAVGINPNASVHLGDLDVPRTTELAFFEEVMAQLGYAVKRHVRSGFDAFIHLAHELPLDPDGHRPVNERFRTLSDRMLRRVMDELAIPYHVVSGDLPARLNTILTVCQQPAVTSMDEAIERAQAEYASLDASAEVGR